MPSEILKYSLSNTQLVMIDSSGNNNFLSRDAGLLTTNSSGKYIALNNNDGLNINGYSGITGQLLTKNASNNFEWKTNGIQEILIGGNTATNLSLIMTTTDPSKSATLNHTMFKMLDIGTNSYSAITSENHYENSSSSTLIRPDCITMSANNMLALRYNSNGIQTYNSTVMDITTSNGLTLQNISSVYDQIIKADISGNPIWGDNWTEKASSDLDMNNYNIKNVGNISMSNDPIHLSQLTSTGYAMPITMKGNLYYIPLYKE
jgi:hypothetical protein